MPPHPKITLRYFDARGRAQFLRAYFHVRGIEFTDERVPLDEEFASWRAMRGNRALSGPLQRLPVLQYGERLVPETFVIAGFVHRAYGDSNSLSDAQNHQHEVLLSSACVDLMLPIGMLIWADVMYQGVDMRSHARSALDRIYRTLDVLEHAVAEWHWAAEMHERPVTLADCLLWEELDQAATLFGPHLRLDDKPHLLRLRTEHPAREAFEMLLSRHACQISGRPGEAGAIRQVQELLDGS